MVNFLELVPEHTWVPEHLLLVNTNWSLDAVTILSHSSLRHTTFLTLLQPHLKARGTPMYRILTYESFKKKNKIVQRGILTSSSSFSLLFSDRFSTFHGHHFRLSSWVDDFPYIIPGDTLDDAYGIGINMLNSIGNIYNFTYQVGSKLNSSGSLTLLIVKILIFLVQAFMKIDLHPVRYTKNLRTVCGVT